MKNLFFCIVVLVASTLYGQVMPVTHFEFPASFASGDITTTAHGILGGEFITTDGSANIYDIEHMRQVGSNTDDYIPVDPVYRLTDGGFYTRAMTTDNDTVLIYTSHYADEWTVLNPHADITVAKPQNGENIGVQSLLYFNDKPVYIYSIYEGSVNPSDPPENRRRAEVYMYNFDSNAFELAHYHFFTNTFFLYSITNIADNELLFVEGFGSHRISRILYNPEDGSVNESLQYNVNQEAGIRLVSTYHAVYNPDDNEVLLALGVQLLSTNGLARGVYRLRLNSEIGDEPRMEKVFELSATMQGTINNFQYVNEEKIGTGYFWYNRRPNGQTITFPDGTQEFHPLGIYLMSLDFENVEPISFGENADMITGICTDVYSYENKLYMTSTPSSPAGPWSPISLQSAGEWTRSDGLVIIDFDPEIEENDTIPSDTTIIDTSIVDTNIIVRVESLYITGPETLLLGEPTQLSVELFPYNASNTDVAWSIVSGNGENAVLSSNTPGLIQANGIGTVTVQVTALDGSGISATKQFFVDEPTSVSSVRDQEIRLWPNPTSHRLQVSGVQYADNFAVYSIDGRIMNINIQDGGDHIIIDVNNLPIGMYFIRTENEMLKFQKQ